MKRFIALAAILSVASAPQAAPLLGKILAGPTNVATFDPVNFTTGPNIDIHYITLANPNNAPVTSIGLNLPAAPGQLLNLSSQPLTFKTSADLPMLGPNKVAESFFVVPFPTNEILGVEIADTADGLRGSFTRSGGGAFLPANSGDVIVAVLSIATGSPVPDYLGFTGNGAINGVLELVNSVPEPSAALLAGLAAVGLLARRW